MNPRTALLHDRLAVVRREWVHVETHMRMRANLMRLVLEKDPERKPVHHAFEYKHHGHHWLCVIHLEADRCVQQALYWWTHRNGGHPRYGSVEAILLRGPERPLHFDSHFFGRYGKRHFLLRDRLTNLFAFFKQHYAMPVRGTGQMHRDMHAFAGAVPEGLVHAALVSPKLISCTTFLDHDHMRTDEQALWLKLMRERGLPAVIPHPATKHGHRPGDGRVVHW